MIEIGAVIAALSAYRARLKADGKLLKAMAVNRCIGIVRGLPAGAGRLADKAVEM